MGHKSNRRKMFAKMFLTLGAVSAANIDVTAYAGVTSITPCSKPCGTGYQNITIGNEFETVECNTTPCTYIRQETCQQHVWHKDQLKTTYGGKDVVFGCRKGRCWSYCGASWRSGEWCYTQGSRGGPFHGKYLKCKTAADCCSQYGYEKCAGRCTIF